MSLTSFVTMTDVVARIKPLRPKLPRRIVAPIKVEPRSNRHMLVGTAFDYLLRFELQRRAPHAVAEPWVAESAPDLIFWETETTTVEHDVLLDTDADSNDYLPPEEVAERVKVTIAEAKAAVATYVKNKAPTRAERTDLAAHAIRLAKLDSVRRGRLLDPQFEEADPEDVQDLLDLIAIVPFDALLHKEVLLLNPTFGDSSRIVGGADADLIVGNLLVDCKTTKKVRCKSVTWTNYSAITCLPATSGVPTRRFRPLTGSGCTIVGTGISGPRRLPFGQAIRGSPKSRSGSSGARGKYSARQDCRQQRVILGSAA